MPSQISERFDSQPATFHPALCSPQPHVDMPLGDRGLAKVAAMTLSELRSAGLVVEVYSSLLDDRFLLAGDNVEIPPDEMRACYSVSEMEGLLQLEPEELKLIHAVKCRLRCKMTVEAA